MYQYQVIREAADYFLQGNSLTATSLYLKKEKDIDIARTTLNEYFKLFGDKNSSFYDSTLYEKILLTKQKLLIESKRKAGKAGRRKQIISDEEAHQIIFTIINQGPTLRELASVYNCSHTTIANAVSRVATQEELSKIKEVYGGNVWRR